MSPMMKENVQRRNLHNEKLLCSYSLPSKDMVTKYRNLGGQNM